MKPLTAEQWLNKNHYSNATPITILLNDYAKYFSEELLIIEKMRDKWQLEWYDKYRLLDINFETYYHMQKKK